MRRPAEPIVIFRAPWRALVLGAGSNSPVFISQAPQPHIALPAHILFAQSTESKKQTLVYFSISFFPPGK